VTRHREYGKIDLERVQQVMRTAALVDGRSVFDTVDGPDAGLVVRAVGKGPEGYRAARQYGGHKFDR
jgi:hypothetical protein